MPRAMAPPPSGEYNLRLTKPFSGHPTHLIEVFGEPNRSSNVSVTQSTSGATTSKKTGTISHEDTQELLSLIEQLRGFPAHSSKDVFGLDTKLEFNTFELQWASDDVETVASDVTAENKQTFKDVVDSIEALGRQFAKHDAAI